MAGEFRGGLSNGGEQIKLSFGAGIPIRDFTYDDLDPWPTGGGRWGPSLVLIDPETVPDHAEAANWAAGVVGRRDAGQRGEPGAGKLRRVAGRRSSHPAQLLDPLVSGAEADPDGDGRLELARVGPGDRRRLRWTCRSWSSRGTRTGG